MGEERLRDVGHLPGSRHRNRGGTARGAAAAHRRRLARYRTASAHRTLPVQYRVDADTVHQLGHTVHWAYGDLRLERSSDAPSACMATLGALPGIIYAFAAPYY